MTHFLCPQREWCIVKLPPLVPITTVDTFYENGFRQFHCGNTLSVEGGGLSGPFLRPLVLQTLRRIKRKYPDTILIGGGGIQNIQDVQEYLNNGADHISVSTLCMQPLQLMRIIEYHS